MVVRTPRPLLFLLTSLINPFGPVRSVSLIPSVAQLGPCSPPLPSPLCFRFAFVLSCDPCLSCPSISLSSLPPSRKSSIQPPSQRSVLWPNLRISQHDKAASDGSGETDVFGAGAARWGLDAKGGGEAIGLCQQTSLQMERKRGQGRQTTTTRRTSRDAAGRWARAPRYSVIPSVALPIGRCELAGHSLMSGCVASLPDG